MKSQTKQSRDEAGKKERKEGRKEGRKEEEEEEEEEEEQVTISDRGVIRKDGIAVNSTVV